MIPEKQLVDRKEVERLRSFSKGLYEACHGKAGREHLEDQALGIDFTLNKLELPGAEMCPSHDSDIQLALAKATPRPPISKVSGGEQVGNVKYDAGVMIYRCPHCHRVITPGTKYCWDCGQAIQWEWKK